MKTTFSFWCILVLLPFAGFSQAYVDWFDFTGGVGIATDQDNNVYTAHYDYNPAGDIYLTKRTQQGVHVWQVKYDQTDNTKWEQASYVETDRDGNIFLCGTLKSGYSSPVNAASIIMKFDSSGVLLWRQVFESSFDGSSTKQCLADAAGNVFVLGIGNGPSGLVTKVKKFDASGNTIWNWYDSAGIGTPVNFKFTADSALVITCRSITGSMNGYARITTSGVTSWSLTGIGSLTVGDAAGDAFGNTYLVHANSISGGGSTIKKVSPAGSVVWSNAFTPISAFFIEVGNDGMPVIGGFPNSGQPGSSFIKVDANGTQVWSNPDADSTFAFLSHARMRLDDQNNIYLAASIMTAMGVCKVNSNGTNGWVVTFPTGYSQNFRIGNDQAIYVVGGTTARIGQSGISSDETKDNLLSQFNIFPIPATNMLNIESSSEVSIPITVSMYDIHGRMVMAVEALTNTLINIDVSSLSKGFYLLRIKGAGVLYDRKVPVN